MTGDEEKVQRDQIMADDKSIEHVARKGNIRNISKIPIRNREGTNHLEDIGLKGRIILKSISEKQTVWSQERVRLGIVITAMSPVLLQEAWNFLTN